jgi:four helix bundle protein
MFLILNHQNMDVYQASMDFVLECYKYVRYLPGDEKFGLISQIKRAALSVHLNVAEGFSRKSLKERKRFFEIARGSMIEVDAALDIAKLNFNVDPDLTTFRNATIKCFKILSGLINCKE